MLKALLENDEVRDCIDHSRPRINGIYHTVLDGVVYQSLDNSDENQNHIAIILYYDDLGVTNPLGANTAQNKLAMFYWTIGNLYPELRSKLSAINLLGIVDYNILKKFGIAKVLEPFIHDLKKLQSEGIRISVGGADKVYKVSLLFCAGDTPAAAYIGGFKQSVSAVRFCRTCEARQNDWKLSFNRDSFCIRNKETHREQVRVISDDGNQPQMQQFWKKRYGINSSSCLSEIEGFDVTQCLPQDVMHVLAEGVLEVHLRNYLKFLVVETKVITLDELNDKISTFRFQHFNRDRPAPILNVHLEKGLRQSACQMIVLALFLPFLVKCFIEDFIENNDESVIAIEERQECFGLLLAILNTCLAYSITESSADYLGRMIESHHINFDRLYPGNLTPKFHFLIHVVYYVKLFGPLRQQACFRFEGLHAYFKSLVPVVKSMKNMPYTLAYRHQALVACNLATRPGQPAKKILDVGPKFSQGHTVLIGNLPDMHLFHNLVAEEERPLCKVMRTKEAIINGTSYKRNVVLLWELEEESLPVFAKAEDLFVLHGELLLKLSLLRSLFHDNHLNAYCVDDDPKPHILIRLTQLSFPHTLLYFSSAFKRYVVLLFHCRTEFVV